MHAIKIANFGFIAPLGIGRSFYVYVFYRSQDQKYHLLYK